MKHLCATCELANSATWEEFEQAIRDQYAAFRKAGGRAFIGFWIPHTTEDAEGHRYVNCPGSISFILAYDEGETTLTFYDEVGQIETLTIPWQEATHGRLDEDSQMFVDQPWLEGGEAYSVLIAARKAVEMLEKLNEDPGNAWFAMADWIKEYE
jgi:hypothetical protein